MPFEHSATSTTAYIKLLLLMEQNDPRCTVLAMSMSENCPTFLSERKFLKPQLGAKLEHLYIPTNIAEPRQAFQIKKTFIRCNVNLDRNAMKSV